MSRSDPTDPKQPVASISVVRSDGATVRDVVAVEEPLEIRVDDQSLAVLVRTPGTDEDLVRGFLFTEGVIDARDDVAALAPCRDPNRPHAHNTVLVRRAAGCDGLERLERAKRAFFASSSCGLCGKATIDNLLQHVRPRSAFAPLSPTVIDALGESARRTQAGFAASGGLHAAVVFTPAGDVVAHAEDVGRHNAVDKVIGALLADGPPLEGRVLWVSGRVAFEVAQKAAIAGALAVVSVGAPTSMAVELARRCRITLVGFAREGRFNVYAGSVSRAQSRGPVP